LLFIAPKYKQRKKERGTNLSYFLAEFGKKKKNPKNNDEQHLNHITWQPFSNKAPSENNALNLRYPLYVMN